MMMIMVRMKMMMMVMEKAVLLAWLLVHWLAEPKLVPRFWSSAPTIHHTEESWKRERYDIISYQAIIPGQKTDDKVKSTYFDAYLRW